MQDEIQIQIMQHDKMLLVPGGVPARHCLQAVTSTKGSTCALSILIECNMSACNLISISHSYILTNRVVMLKLITDIYILCRRT